MNRSDKNKKRTLNVLFSLTFSLIHTLFSPYPNNNLPEWVLSLASLLLGCHHIAFALWYIVGCILNMCFAHMRPPTPTLWVFLLANFSPRPLFSPQLYDKLPGWVFLLTFLFIRPRRGFSRLPISLHAHFSLRNLTISFRDGFSRLLFSSYTHVVGFSAHFLPPTPTFLSATYR